MLSRPRNAVLFALALSLLAGFFVTGHYLYKAPIGLDPSAFLLGDWIQVLVPGAGHAVAGPFWALASLIAVAGVSVWLVRRAVAGGIDPERRSFLTRAGSGAGMALGSLVLGLGAGAARAFLGVGTGTKGWAPVGSQINDREVPFTHPEWKDAWKGSHVQNYRRFGRTGWNVSDIVLGTGRIGGAGRRADRQARDRARRQLLRHLARLLRRRQRDGDGQRDPISSARPAVHRLEVLHAGRSPAAGHAGRRNTSRRSKEASRGSVPTTSTSATSTLATRSRASWTRTCTRRSTA